MTAVVLLGKGDLAIRIAAWFRASPDHTLAAVVPVMPEPTWTGSLTAWAKDHSVPVVASGHYRDLPPGLEAPDLALSVFYDKIIRQAFIERCGRILNLHNSPLPRYRGMAPINWALNNNEPEHGVTLHEIVEAVDAGPVVAQVRFSIWPEQDEVRDVYRRCLAFGYELFEQTIPRLGAITAVPQDEAEAVYYTAKDQARLGDRRWFTRAEAGPR